MGNSTSSKSYERVVVKDSNYYYGIEIIKYKRFEYEDVLYIKILAAKKVLEKLVRDEDMKDKHRINDVTKAINFNKKLLLELGYSLGSITKKINKLQEEGKYV